MSEPTPPQPAVTVVNPLQWQIGNGQADNGTKVVVLILNQGLLTSQVALMPTDAEAIAKGLEQGAAQARTSLILPAGTQLPPIPKMNGGGG